MITAVNIDAGKGGQVRVFCGTLAQVPVPYGERARSAGSGRQLDELPPGQGSAGDLGRAGERIPMFNLINRWAAKHLALPEPLKSAVAEGRVARNFAADGQAVFVLAPDCPDRAAIVRAIETHSTWQLWIAQAEGVLVGLAVVSLACFAFAG
jgi:hypothetical protein